MTTWRKPTPEDVDNALANIGKEIDRLYFFSRLQNPEWLKPLADRGTFQSPPEAVHLSDTTVQYPFWPELQYLQNISQFRPNEIANIILVLPTTTNIRIYDHLVALALEMPPSVSPTLLPKLLQTMHGDHLHIPLKTIDLVTHWIEYEQISAAMELAKHLIAFQPDPKAEEKRQLWLADPNDYRSLLDPTPRLDEWHYTNLLSGPVRALSQRTPLEMARILADAAANAIYLRYHREELRQRNANDGSLLWCQRLSNRDLSPRSARDRLVHALTFTCELAFGATPTETKCLHNILTKQRWNLFKRLQHHLYAAFPTEHIKPWIREAILSYDDYNELEYRYEFQQMLAAACTTFGNSILTSTEIDEIVASILSGPSKKKYIEWYGSEYTEETFERHRQRFHLLQLGPFAPLLSGSTAQYYRDLTTAADQPITDNDYCPIQEVKSGIVRDSSPRSQAELQQLTDEELLNYINHWDDEHRDDDDWLVRISISGLSKAFEEIVRQTIVPDKVRLSFWLSNGERIQRPIYVYAIVMALHSHLKNEHIDRLTETFTFCEWVLSHQDHRELSHSVSRQDSRESLNWSPSRRAVLDLIETCLKPDSVLPAAAHTRIASILGLLATQYDYRLDNDDPVIQNSHDHFTEAINNTRSRTLNAAVSFWTRLATLPDGSDTELAISLLDRRLSPNLPHPLTLPEYAILGSCFGTMINLDESWAANNRASIFPRQTTSKWQSSFGAFLAYAGPSEKAYRILCDEYDLAIACPDFLETLGDTAETNARHLGHHLFIYYLWGLFPLHGDASPLAKFYQSTAMNRDIWADLLNHIGFLVRNSTSDLGRNLVNRIVDFFEWRITVGDPVELSAHTLWIQAECLDQNWRLRTCSRVLDIIREGDVDPSSILMLTEELLSFLPDHAGQVVECFAKLTDAIKSHAYGVPDETAKTIIMMGLSSNDSQVIEHAKRARDNLLRLGRFDLLQLDGDSNSK